MKEITLGQGLDNITFGLSRPEVIQLLGEPSEVEPMDGDNNSGAMEAWHYDDHHLSLSFEEDCNWRLTSITTASPEVLFEGIDLIGLSQGEVMEQMEVFNLGDFELEDLSTDVIPNQSLASNSDFSLNLFFDHDILTEIQWGPYWDDEAEAPIWPEVQKN
ncbi:hypothetical protein KDU71_19260 [Carboxylicivirga sediminis]|uniref:Uncharacterized protein n=1 Tax=Carboxylicivirga sediminis TaxID=2006564 RepID=A0A941IZV2_9BACT|nr:hypothetical protein [Carboxylicivirga sediminis]MBR8537718.1 hypothetical protein [Carboxylicivirga sediminis]